MITGSHPESYENIIRVCPCSSVAKKLIFIPDIKCFILLNILIILSYNNK